MLRDRGIFLALCRSLILIRLRNAKLRLLHFLLHGLGGLGSLGLLRLLHLDLVLGPQQIVQIA